MRKREKEKRMREEKRKRERKKEKEKREKAARHTNGKTSVRLWDRDRRIKSDSRAARKAD